MAVRSGTKRIIATPHFHGVQESLEQMPHILRQFRQLQAAIRQEVPELTLIPGAEIL